MQQKARNSRYLEGVASTNGKGSKHRRPQWEMSHAQRQNITGSTEKFPKHRQKHSNVPSTDRNTTGPNGKGPNTERNTTCPYGKCPKNREKQNRPLREMS